MEDLDLFISLIQEPVPQSAKKELPPHPPIPICGGDCGKPVPTWMVYACVGINTGGKMFCPTCTQKYTSKTNEQRMRNRKLDAHVAQTVMQSKLMNLEFWTEADPDNCGWHLHDGWCWLGIPGDAHEWRPSIDIKCAWELVKKLSSMGKIVLIQEDEDSDKPWFVSFANSATDYSPARASAVTIEKAICLAALAAVGESIKTYQ